MGLSRFFKPESTEPKVSAFDLIPDDTRQMIANDICAIIECIKTWKVAVKDDYHASTMANECKEIGKTVMAKFISGAMTGNTDLLDKLTSGDLSEDWIPEALRDVVQRVKASLNGASNGPPPESA